MQFHKPISVVPLESLGDHPLIQKALLKDGLPVSPGTEGAPLGFWIQPKKGRGRQVPIGDYILTEAKNSKAPYDGRVWLLSEWKLGEGEPLEGLAVRAMALADQLNNKKLST